MIIANLERQYPNPESFFVALRFLFFSNDANRKRVAGAVFLDLLQRLRNFACSRTAVRVLFQHSQDQISKCEWQMRFQTRDRRWYLRSYRMQVTNHRFRLEGMTSGCEF